MSEMLILNPSARPRKRRKTAKRASPAQRRARKAFASMARRRNPAPVVAAVRSNIRRRRRNPVAAARRRRRNPIGSGAKLSVKSIMSMVKDAAIGGAGAVGMDVLMGKINPHLPVSLQLSPTKIGAGDAVKALATVVLGKVLKKPTRGLSEKMALGALTTQARDLISTMLPASVTVAGLGYSNPAHVVAGSNRIGPIRNVSRNTGAQLAAYTRPGQTPLLNGMGAYMAPGRTALLSGSSPREREGYMR